MLTHLARSAHPTAHLGECGKRIEKGLKSNKNSPLQKAQTINKEREKNDRVQGLSENTSTAL